MKLTGLLTKKAYNDGSGFRLKSMVLSVENYLIFTLLVNLMQGMVTLASTSKYRSVILINHGQGPLEKALHLINWGGDFELKEAIFSVLGDYGSAPRRPALYLSKKFQVSHMQKPNRIMAYSRFVLPSDEFIAKIPQGAGFFSSGINLSDITVLLNEADLDKESLEFPLLNGNKIDLQYTNRMCTKSGYVDCVPTQGWVRIQGNSTDLAFLNSYLSYEGGKLNSQNANGEKIEIQIQPSDLLRLLFEEDT